MGVLAFFLLLGVLAAVLVALYNRLVTARNAFRNAFAQIDVQLTRRHDLVPNLVEATRAYLKHERETLEAVIAARDGAEAGLRAAARDPANPSALQALSGAEARLDGALGRLFAVSEAYPELRASESIGRLTEELTSTENRVAFARQAFNDAVMNYNNARETFPGNFVAGLFTFPAAEPLEGPPPAAREAPRVTLT